MLQTSFATTSTQQKKCMEKTTYLHKRFGKRDNTEIHKDEEQLKKTKCDLENYRFPVTPVQRKFPGPAGMLPDDYVDNKSISEIFQSDKSNNVVSSFMQNFKLLIYLENQIISGNIPLFPRKIFCFCKRSLAKDGC